MVNCSTALGGGYVDSPTDDIGSWPCGSAKDFLHCALSDASRAAHKHADETIQKLALGVRLAHCLDADHLEVRAELEL